MEQRELYRLRDLGATADHRALVVTIRARVDASIGDCRDTMPYLAGLAGVKIGTARRALAWLRERGVLDQRCEPVHGGPRGTAWSCRRRVLPFEQWQDPSQPATDKSDGPPPWEAEGRRPGYEELKKWKDGGNPL